MPPREGSVKIWHLRFASDGRHPLFRTEAERRAAVLVLVRAAGDWLVTFGIVDDHLHVVVVCSRVRAGKLSRALVLGLRPIAGMGFEPSYMKPVESRSHLQRLVGYTIEQPAKHGLEIHPAIWSGSSFSDIVGARATADFRICTSDVLPRYRASEAWKSSGLSAQGIQPLSDRGVFVSGLTPLVDAASFALCAPPKLEGRTRREAHARAVVVSLGRAVGYRAKDIASVLQVSPEAVRKLGLRPVDERALNATRLRMAIVQTITPSVDHPPRLPSGRP